MTSKIEGVEIEIGGEEYTCPPLGLHALGRMAALESAPDADNLSPEEKYTAVTLTTVHAALTRNYPDLTLEEIQQKIHIWEVLALYEVLPALHEKGGFERLRKAREERKGGIEPGAQHRVAVDDSDSGKSGKKSQKKR